MNNIKQKNAISKIQNDTNLPYSSKEHVDHQYSNYNVDMFDVNHSMQQLLDNDLYIQKSLEQSTTFRDGPKANNESTISSQCNGYKMFGDISTSDTLDVLRKVETPLSSTLSKVLNESVHFITQYGNTIYAGTASGLKYTSDINGSNWVSTGIYANGYSNTTAHLIFAANDGVYELFENVDLDSSSETYGTQITSFIKLNSDSIDADDVSLDLVNGILAVVSDGKIYESNYDLNTTVDAKKNSLVFQQMPLVYDGELQDNAMKIATCQSNGKRVVADLNRLYDSNSTFGIDLFNSIDIPEGYENINCIETLDNYLFAGTSSGIFYNCKGVSSKIENFDEQIEFMSKSGSTMFVASTSNIFAIDSNMSCKDVFQNMNSPYGNIAKHDDLAITSMIALADDIYVFSSNYGTFIVRIYGTSIKVDEILDNSNNSIVNAGSLAYDNKNIAICSSNSLYIVNLSEIELPNSKINDFIVAYTSEEQILKIVDSSGVLVALTPSGIKGVVDSTMNATIQNAVDCCCFTYNSKNYIAILDRSGYVNVVQVFDKDSASIVFSFDIGNENAKMKNIVICGSSLVFISDDGISYISINDAMTNRSSSKTTNASDGEYEKLVSYNGNAYALSNNVVDCFVNANAMNMFSESSSIASIDISSINKIDSSTCLSAIVVDGLSGISAIQVNGIVEYEENSENHICLDISTVCITGSQAVSYISKNNSSTSYEELMYVGVDNKIEEIDITDVDDGISARVVAKDMPGKVVQFSNSNNLSVFAATTNGLYAQSKNKDYKRLSDRSTYKVVFSDSADFNSYKQLSTCFYGYAFLEFDSYTFPNKIVSCDQNLSNFKVVLEALDDDLEDVNVEVANNQLMTTKSASNSTSVSYGVSSAVYNNVVVDDVLVHRSLSAIPISSCAMQDVVYALSNDDNTTTFVLKQFDKWNAPSAAVSAYNVQMSNISCTLDQHYDMFAIEKEQTSAVVAYANSSSIGFACIGYSNKVASISRIENTNIGAIDGQIENVRIQSFNDETGDNYQLILEIEKDGVNYISAYYIYPDITYYNNKISEISSSIAFTPIEDLNGLTVDSIVDDIVNNAVLLYSTDISTLVDSRTMQQLESLNLQSISLSDAIAISYDSIHSYVFSKEWIDYYNDVDFNEFNKVVDGQFDSVAYSNSKLYAIEEGILEFSNLSSNIVDFNIVDSQYSGTFSGIKCLSNNTAYIWSDEYGLLFSFDTTDEIEFINENNIIACYKKHGIMKDFIGKDSYTYQTDEYRIDVLRTLLNNNEVVEEDDENDEDLILLEDNICKIDIDDYDIAKIDSIVAGENTIDIDVNAFGLNFLSVENGIVSYSNNCIDQTVSPYLVRCANESSTVDFGSRILNSLASCATSLYASTSSEVLKLSSVSYSQISGVQTSVLSSPSPTLVMNSESNECFAITYESDDGTVLANYNIYNEEVDDKKFYLSGEQVANINSIAVEDNNYIPGNAIVQLDDSNINYSADSIGQLQKLNIAGRIDGIRKSKDSKYMLLDNDDEKSIIKYSSFGDYTQYQALSNGNVADVSYLEEISNYIVAASKAGIWRYSNSGLKQLRSMHQEYNPAFASYSFNGNEDNYLFTKNGTLLSSTNCKMWKEILSIDENPMDVNSVLAVNSKTYAIATDDGLYSTQYKYEIVHDNQGFSQTSALELYDETMSMDGGISSICQSAMSSHIEEEHSDDSFIEKVQNDYLDNKMQKFGGWTSYSGEASSFIVKNDVVNEIQFGKFSDGDVVVQINNFLCNTGEVFQPSDMTYIMKRWMSGITELYINVPTTNTYYINNMYGTANCFIDPSYASTRKNLKNFGEDKQQQDSQMSSHYSTIVVGITSSEYHIDNVLDVQINGNSLPLGIYKEYNQSDGSSLFKSYIEPSVVKTYDTAKTDDAGNYIFTFGCFGSDAQAIKIMFYDSVARIGRNWIRIKFDANGGDGEMPQQKFVLDDNGVIEQKQLKKCTFTNESSGYSKIFAGWTLQPTSDNYSWNSGAYDGTQMYQPQGTWPGTSTVENQLKEMMRSAAFENKDEITLYASWLTYQFNSNDTTLVLNSNKSDFYIDSVGVDESTNLKDNVIINFGE